MSERLDLARKFARSLDEEDYATTAECLAASCTYETGGVLHRGTEEILASYREHGERAAALLERVRYESSVRRGADRTVIVAFVDHLEHRGRTHTYQCEQHLRFTDGRGADLRISGIRHSDLPGERAALARFFTDVGIPMA